MTDISKLIYSADCKNCGKPFIGKLPTPGTTLRRKTCSRSCAVSLSWKKPDVKAARIAAIRIERASPKAKARAAAFNTKRWAREGERERLSEWNKARWANPDIKKSLSGAIKKAQAKPEYRKALSARKVELWKNSAYRASHTEAVRQALSSPENRARASAVLRRRWQDPVKRQAMLDGHARMIAKKHAMFGRLLTEMELAVLDTIISKCTNGIYMDDLRALCRDAGVSSTQIAKIIDSLIIQRKVIKMRQIPNALRVSGRGIAA